MASCCVRYTLLCLLVIVCVQGDPDRFVLAQAFTPRLNALQPSGGQAGTSFTVTIASGESLEGVTGLRFSHPGITAKQKVNPPTVNWPLEDIDERTFTVTVNKDVPPGFYEARFVCRHGVSTPRLFSVSDRKEVAEVEPNNTVAQAMPLPIDTVVNAAADASNYDHYKLSLKKGQRVLIHCFGERIDSQLDATMSLTDASGSALVTSRNAIRRDPFIDFTAKADGEYFVRVHDVTFRGGGEMFYRLVASTGPHVDFVLPAAGAPGSKGSYTVFGRNLEGGEPSPSSVGGAPLQMKTVTIALPNADAVNAQAGLGVGGLVRPDEALIAGTFYRYADKGGHATPIRMGLTSTRTVVENESNGGPDKAQKVSPPIDITGQFATDGDIDSYVFDAKQGQRWRIRLLSDRLGKPTDVSMLVQQITTAKDGKVAARDLNFTDDVAGPITGDYFNTSTRDATWQLTAPTDGLYRVVVRDQSHKGDPRHVYRLVIEEAQPRFELLTIGFEGDPKKKASVAAAPIVGRAGSALLPVFAIRKDGFNGEISLRAEGLPVGVTAEPGVIAAGATSGSLLLRAAADVKPWAGEIQVIGQSKIDGKDVVVHARAGEVQWPGQQNVRQTTARLGGAPVLGVNTHWQAPITGGLSEKQLTLSRAAKHTLPIKLARQAGFKGNVTVTAAGLPKEIKATTLQLKGDKADGGITLTVDQRARPGTYNLTVSAGTQADVARDEEAVNRVNAAKQKIEALNKQYAAELAAATKAEKAAAPDGKAAAQAKVREVTAKVNGIKQAQKTLASRLKAAQALAKKTKANVSIPLGLITLRIEAAPVKAGPVRPIALQAGKAVDLPVALEKLPGFDDAVTAELAPAKGMTGVTAAKVTIAKGQAAGKLQLKAAPNAATGRFNAILRLRTKYNGANLVSDHPVTLTIQPAK